MRKLTALLFAVLTIAWTTNSYAALNAVAGDRADNATDRTDGVTFNDLGAWTLTVAAGNSLGSTGGVSAATAGTGDANAGTLTFAGSTTVSGTIGTAGNQLLALNFNGSGATASLNTGTVGAVTTTVGSGATLDVLKNVTLTGALTTTSAAGTVLDLNDFTITQTGIFTQGALATIRTNASSSSAFGKITSTGNAVIGNTTVDVHVTGALSSGTALKILDGAAGGTNGATITVTDDSAIYTFSGANATGDITVTPTRTNTLNAIGTTSNNQTVGASLEAVAGTSTGDLANVQNALAMLSSTAEVDSALGQLDPEVNAGINGATMTAINENLNLVLGRLDSVQNAPAAKTGVNTGDTAGSFVWIKGFGTYISQDDRKGVNGYDAGVLGTAIGGDGRVNDYWRLGLSGGYAYSDIDSNGNDDNTTVDGYQGTIYAGYTPDSPWYFNGAFSFGWNNYEGARHITFGGINRQADADYDGQQYTGYVDANYKIETGDFVITPTASLQYVHTAVEGYTETGADSLNLTVDDQSYDFLQSGLGAKVSRAFEASNGTFIPQVHAKWLYDFIGDEQVTTSAFTGGGASFVTRGADPAQSSFNLGAGVTFVSLGNVTVDFNYDFEVKSDYTSHSGVLMFKFAY